MSEMMWLILIILIGSMLVNYYLLWQIKKKQPDLQKDFTRQRQELTLTLKTFGDSLESRLDRLTDLVNQRLETMRQTVDEKLQSSLERRLGESFKQVQSSLEIVARGLGEMQQLANGVGDLKKVLTNVKTRGTWGEVQLGNLLEQFLAKANYVENVNTRPDSKERVEFAIKLPGKTDDKVVLLPIDAKFPLEDYQRLQEALEQGQKEAVELARKNLGLTVKKCAKDIQQKYLQPPATTDFAILYLPLEGLYGEVTQNLNWCETIQRDYRVTIMGPNTIVAFLSSLQLGFKTLAIEKRSAEVWTTLGQIQNEFGKFGELLTKTQKKIQEASNIIGEAQSKTNNIGRKLAQVEKNSQLKQLD